MGIRKCATLIITLLTFTLSTLTATLVEAPAAWTQGQNRAYTLIRDYWPKRYKQARQVAWCESRFYKYAHNPSGASGVFQLMPFWWDGANSLGWQFDPYNLRKNLYYAHQIFRRSHFQWTDWVCQPR